MIAIIKATFNPLYTDLLEKGCATHLTQLNTPFETFECPGAVELVGYTKKLMDSKKYDAIITIGAIIKGDTDHYEYVCQFVTNGISTLATQSSIPIIYGVLTTQTEELAYERAALDRMNKGKEFAEAAIFMMEAFARVK